MGQAVDSDQKKRAGNYFHSFSSAGLKIWPACHISCRLLMEIAFENDWRFGALLKFSESCRRLGMKLSYKFVPEACG